MTPCEADRCQSTTARSHRKFKDTHANVEKRDTVKDPTDSLGHRTTGVRGLTGGKRDDFGTEERESGCRRKGQSTLFEHDVARKKVVANRW